MTTNSSRPWRPNTKAILQWPQWCDPNVASPRTGDHDGNSRQAPDQEIGRRFPINLVQLSSTMFNLLHFVWKSLKSFNKLEHQLALKTQGWASQCSQTGLEPHRCTRLHHDFLLMGFLGTGGRGQISFQTLPLIFEVSYGTVEIPRTLITYYNLWMVSFCTICYLCFVANRMHPDALSFLHWASPWRAWRGRRICKPRSESAWAFERPKKRRVCSPAVLCSIAICIAMVPLCCNMLQYANIVNIVNIAMQTPPQRHIAGIEEGITDSISSPVTSNLWTISECQICQILHPIWKILVFKNVQDSSNVFKMFRPLGCNEFV